MQKMPKKEESSLTEGNDERQESNQENKNEPMSFSFLSGLSCEVSQELRRKKPWI